MSATHKLHLVYPKSYESRVPPLDALAGTPLPQFFSQATGGKLILEVERRVVDFSPVGCTSEVLHDVVDAILASRPGEPADEIALVFAGSWHSYSADLLGLMFDRDGVEPALGERLTARDSPRQACAVFLDALQLKGKSPPDIIHTAVHELGHVYNLQHDPAQESFMGDQSTSVGFTGADCRRLLKASEGIWDYVPGGAHFGEFPFTGGT